MDEQGRLPHRFPFQMVKGKGAGGAVELCLSSDDARVRGGVVPVWAVVEAMAQAAGLAAFECAGKTAYLVAVSRFRCPRPLRAGDRLRLSGRIEAGIGAVVRVRLTCRSAGRLVAAGTFTLVEEAIES
jgi:hypothetical protein